MVGGFVKARIRTGVLTLSDKAARGERVDTSGAAIRELSSAAGAQVTRYEVIPDERELIVATLRAWADGGDLDLIVTTGGTGLSPRDVTPEATAAVLDYHVPGMAEAMRAEGLRHTPMAMLSRAVCGVRGRTLIVNLPGSEKGVRESLSVLLPVLAHAVETLRGPVEDHGH
jgi:molybdopterin adenylyltransferase